MKISLFVGNIHLGTFGNLISYLAKGLLKLGWQVEVVHTDSGAAQQNFKFPNGVLLYNLKTPKAIFSLLPILSYLRRRRPNVLIAFTPAFNVIAIIARILSQWKGLVVVTEHAIMSVSCKTEFRNQFLLSKAPFFIRHFYQWADGVVSVSKDVQQDLVDNIGLCKNGLLMTSIPNPVDVDFVIKKAALKAEHQWFTKKDLPIIINVGRLSIQKNQLLLLEAFARVIKKVKARLVIIGEGPERNNIEQKIRELGIEERVSLIGFDPNPFCYMASADLFVLSSTEEGFGLVLVEAMACRCPVVTTGCPGGPREILQSGKYGVIVPSENVKALATAILRGLTDVKSLEKYREPAFKRALEYQPQYIAKKWEQYILTLLRNKGFYQISLVAAFKRVFGPP